MPRAYSGITNEPPPPSRVRSNRDTVMIMMGLLILFVAVGCLSAVQGRQKAHEPFSRACSRSLQGRANVEVQVGRWYPRKLLNG